jgi:iron complex outermembrane receptor protein
MSSFTRSFRSRLLLCAATALVCGVVPAVADPAAPANVNLAPGVGGVQYAQAGTTTSSSSRSSEQSIEVKAKARLLRDKNSPSAVTELGQKAIEAVGVGGSTSQLLRQAPSVYVYQQGIGDNAPVLTIRGLRGLEVATTLDGIPIQDLEAPGSFYLANNIGGVVTTNQIAGVSIYPGVAYPDKNTFGTIGGTVAYDTKRPTNDAYFDVTGSVGSFGTYSEGFEANSGAIDGPWGRGDNAPKVLLSYKNLQSQGFIDGTSNRENEMEFAFDKPYDDGLSKFQATVLYNQADGYIENEPVPTAYTDKFGRYSNYPTYLNNAFQNNDFLTVILKDETYINDYVTVGSTAFYIQNDQQLNDYSSILLDVPGGSNTPVTVNGTSPFINNPGGFGEGGLFGPPIGGGGFGIFGGGYGGYFYGSGNHYNPLKLYPAGSKDCPQSYLNQFWGGSVLNGAPCGLNDQITGSSSYTYGITPHVVITPPDIFGIQQTIKIGGLVAKETSPSGYEYLGGDPNTPQDPANSASVQNGGSQRTIYQGYVQDKLDFLDNTLHITPGATLEGTYSSIEGAYVFNSKASPANGPNGVFNGGTNLDNYGPFKGEKWDREFLPFFNVSYDLDKILPVAKGVSIYGSVGNSALFAPVGDFGPSTSGTPPFASIVHLYEAGVKYNVSDLALSADYYYQKVDRDFGFYSSQTGTTFGDTVYSGVGQREFKGFEAAAIYQVTPTIQLFGNVSHQLAKYLTTGLDFDTVAEDQYGVSIKGSPISGIPDWLSTFGADYDKKSIFLDNDHFNVRLTGQYTGHQYTTCDLTLFDPSCGTVYVQHVPGVDYSGGPQSNNVFNTFTGATTTDRNGGGISPFAVFNLDINYKLPTPQLPVVKNITFDLNIQNLFNQVYNQYFYKQVSPVSCKVSAKDPTGNPYGCTPQFSDAIPGEPFAAFFTVTARF